MRQAAGPEPSRLAETRTVQVVTLEADIRVEKAPPNRVRVPGLTRHASPSVATFPHGEADECASAERICIGFDDHLRTSKLPWGGLLVEDGS